MSRGLSKEVHPEKNGFRTIYVYGLIKITGWISLIMGLLFLIFPFTVTDEFLTVFLVSFSLAIIFGLSGVYFVIGSKKHLLTFNLSEAQLYSYFGKEHNFRLNQVKNITINGFTNNLTLHLEDERKLILSQFMIGLIHFIEKLESEKNSDYSKLKKRILFK